MDWQRGEIPYYSLPPGFVEREDLTVEERKEQEKEIKALQK
jgi:hypothetical protein